MIAIRVDGNAQLGTGHIMRCLSIANALDRAGAKPLFFCAEKSETIINAGYTCIALGGNYKEIAKENLLPILQEHGVKTIFIDSYYTNFEYFTKLEGINRAVLFDMGDDSIPCELLIDYNINYKDFDFINAKDTLLGAKYAPLRQEFALNANARDISAVRSILLTLGGSDPAGATTELIKAIKQHEALKNKELCVVVGAMNSAASDIKALAGGMEGISIFENISNMAELMKKCDIAVSAGGSTLYEICASGLPCVAISIADNQDAMIEGMSKAKAMLSAGLYRTGKQACLERVCANVLELCKNSELRKDLSQKSSKMADGNGASRIAEKLIKLNVL